MEAREGPLGPLAVEGFEKTNGVRKLDRESERGPQRVSLGELVVRGGLRRCCGSTMSSVFFLWSQLLRVAFGSEPLLQVENNHFSLSKWVFK